jgi:peptide/nickel transport system substrate-binding protein
MALALGVLLTFVAACTSSGASTSLSTSAGASGGGAGGPVSLGETFMVSQWDPAQSVNPIVDFPYLAQVYDRLLLRKADGSLAPMLASGWQVASDSKSITLHLRSGVTFADGSKMDANLVIQNLRRYQQAKTAIAAQLANVTSISAVNASTVRLTLKQADPLVLYNLSWSAGLMVGKNGLADPVALSKKPDGSGAFTLQGQTPTAVTFVRNPSYWDKTIEYAPKLMISNILDPSARINAFQTGQINIASVKLGDNYTAAKSLVAAGKGQLYSYKSNAQYQIFLNTKVAPLGQPAVRQALSLAIDRSELNTALLNGQCTPSSSVAPAGTIGHVGGLDAVRTDVATAKSLLRSAGVSSLTIHMLVPSSAPFTLIAPALQQMFAKIGVNLLLDQVEVQSAFPTWRQGGSEAMLNQATIPVPDTVAYAEDSVIGPDSPGGAPSDIVALINAARPAPIGSPQRDTAEQAITKALYDSPLQLPICQIPDTYLYAKAVSGADNLPYASDFDAPDARFLNSTPKS